MKGDENKDECDAALAEPAAPKSLLAVLAALKPLEEDFPPILDPPPKPVKL